MTTSISYIPNIRTSCEFAKSCADTTTTKQMTGTDEMNVLEVSLKYDIHL